MKSVESNGRTMSPAGSRHFCILVLAALQALTNVGSAQQASTNSKLSPRDLFYQRSGSEVRNRTTAASESSTNDSGAKTLALRYSILYLNAAGEATEVDPERVFRSGDRVRLEIRSNDHAFLYVLYQGSRGDWDLLFPRSDVPGEVGNRISPGRASIIPASSFVFDNDPGFERLFLVLSRKPENDVQKLLRSVGAGATTVNPEAMAGWFRARGMMVDVKRSDLNAADKENAVYVAPAANAEQERVVAEVVLRHD